MFLENLKNNNKKRRKRVGRGDSSGLGRTCGRGEKGQKSRSGATTRLHFEGGQMPLFRRLPYRRGFKAVRHKNYTIVNLSALNKKFNKGDVVGVEEVIKNSLVNGIDYGLKILGVGEIENPMTIKAHSFSKVAKEKIEKAGGKAILID